MTLELLGVVAVIGLTISAARSIARRAAVRPHRGAFPMRTRHAVGLLEGDAVLPWIPARTRLPHVAQRMVRVQRNAGPYMHLELHTDGAEQACLVELELGPLDQDGAVIRLVEIRLSVDADGRLRARAEEKSGGARVPLTPIGPGAPGQPTYVPVEDDPRTDADLAAERPEGGLDDLVM